MAIVGQNEIAVIGECMLELSLDPQACADDAMPAQLAFGGDTLNMSVYLARLGSHVEFITALGDDSLSDWLVDRWQAEGVSCSHVSRHANKVPGMYMIELDEAGERSFKYWRAGSPASRIIDSENHAEQVFTAISRYATLFLSGISLAILKPQAREKIIQFLTEYRSSGGKVIFDSNYRPSLWKDIQEAQDCYRQVYRATDIALPTFDDEQAIFAYDSPERATQEIHDLGVAEIVVKMGQRGCLYSSNGSTGLVPVEPVNSVDTTSAGDSFNAGYLAQRLSGAPVERACVAGHALASTVIQHRGAIIPVDAMRHLLPG